MRFIILILAILVNVIILSAFNATQYVNPFIGTAKHGHTFPGPTRPFALVQVSPDNRVDGWDWCSGYHYSDSVMLGFSHTHLSGTGIGDLGDILLCPQIGKVNFMQGSYANPDTGYAFRFSHKFEKANVGYYSVLNTDDSINIELTSSARVGLHRYTFPKTNNANVIIDLGSTIYDPKRQNTIESQLEVINNTTLQGYKIVKGWAPLRKVYFYIQFSKPFIAYSANDGLYDNNMKFTRHSGKGVVASVTFNTNANQQVLAKVAISFNSINNAKQNINEINNWDFDNVVKQSIDEWNSYLSKIEIEGTEAQKQIFYTAFYHTFIQPNNIADANGEYYGPDYKNHKSQTGNYYSTFSLWDTYRAVHPLYTILIPDKVGDMANSMLQHFTYNGYLPIWTLAGTENHCMIGNHSIPVLADAIIKNIPGFDYKKAFEAMIVSTTVDHPSSNWQKVKYDSVGYMPCNADWQGSARTFDFCFDDWCVAQVAQKLGDTAKYKYYLNRSNFYKNLFNKQRGLTWPRNIDGTFKSNFNVNFISWYSDYTEGNAWQYTFVVQHNLKGLIELYPSTEKFLEKFDSLFVKTNVPVSEMNDIEVGNFGQYIHSNEPSHHIAYLYNYAGQAHKTQSLVNNILNTEYSNSPDGLAGNEDCGQMSAWYIFSALGFYPLNPASGNYDFGCPIISNASIKLSNGNTFKVIAKNMSDKNVYIQSITLNGKPYNYLYINHSTILKGGTLEFIMDSKPNYKLNNYLVPVERN